MSDIKTNTELRGNFITETKGHDVDSSSMRGFTSEAAPTPAKPAASYDTDTSSMRGFTSFQK